MLAATGHNDLDKAIQGFWEANAVLRAPRPQDGITGVRVQNMADPQLARDRCGHVANLLSQHLNGQGFATVVSDDCMIYLAKGDLKEAALLMLGDGDEHVPTPEDHGYTDRTIPGAKDHCAVLVQAGNDVLMVDLTAAQYGYEQIPLVQRQLPDGSWERDFSRPKLNAVQAPEVTAADCASHSHLGL